MVHSLAMTQITADLMGTHCNQLFRGSISCFRSFDKHMLWPPRYLEDFFLQITKIEILHITFALLLFIRKPLNTPLRKVRMTSRQSQQCQGLLYFQRFHVVNPIPHRWGGGGVG